MLSRIHSYELINQAWRYEGRETEAPNLSQYIEYFHQVCRRRQCASLAHTLQQQNFHICYMQYVPADLGATDESDVHNADCEVPSACGQRAHHGRHPQDRQGISPAVLLLVSVFSLSSLSLAHSCQRCRELGNYGTLGQILVSLYSRPVARLKKVWAVRRPLHHLFPRIFSFFLDSEVLEKVQSCFSAVAAYPYSRRLIRRSRFQARVSTSWRSSRRSCHLRMVSMNIIGNCFIGSRRTAPSWVLPLLLAADYTNSCTQSPNVLRKRNCAFSFAPQVPSRRRRTAPLRGNRQDPGPRRGSRQPHQGSAIR